ncbi:putative dipeptide ABC transporter dipeptide binding protein [Methanococcus maripaludis KA1]|uniref:Putative dipeptide ABC transporter dipeptide binding protein n=1 Tax=Methanococcus maripaludis KA1 TaxID=637914 RepID=A0A2Z5PTX2_METMI|nr:ABC transporter substrate-binding protein [Methanococcus maripaludis]BAP61421.1 putative dipeptide ABC transporter dipeptide binding protein [Methanococcus maripaludis KA1]
MLKTGTDGDFTYDLATDYSVSPDGLTWTVNIRNDAKFSDDSKLTAKDVAFTFNQAKVSASKLDMTNLKEAIALDDDTVVFKLYNVDSTFIWKLRYVGIVPEATYDAETYGQNPIGSGPYVLVQWDKGQQAIFEYNENYYGKEPYFKKITIVFSKPDTSLAAVKAGQSDIGEVDVINADQVVEGYRLVSLSAGMAHGMSLPTLKDMGETTEEGNVIGNNVTSDLAIRKALNVAINRKEIIENVFNGYGAPEYTAVDQRLYGNPDAKITDSDIKAAKQILEEGGWVDADGDGIIEKNGLKAEFKLYYYSGDQLRQSLATIMAEQAKKIGINIELIGADWDTIYSKQYSSACFYRQGSISPYGCVYAQFHSKESDGSYLNPNLYSNSVVDKYLEEAMSSPTQEQAKGLWQKAAYDGTNGFGPAGDAPWVWIATVDFLYQVKDDIDVGTPPNALGADLFINILDWKRTDGTN